MRRLFVLAVILFVLAGYGFAQDVKEVEEAMRKVFPNIGSDGFRESPVKGLYEIAAGSQIFYFHPNGYLIFGEIWSKDGKSITAERRSEITAAKLKDLSLDKAIKIGSGKNKIIEISDPDCSYCRKASGFFSKRTDVTRYVFLYPLKQIHPDAEKKSKYILCSADRQRAYEEVFEGKMDKAFTLASSCEPKSSELLLEHEKTVNGLGIKGTPAFLINGQFIAGANIPAIESLLEGGDK